jgi:hypothetical protein
MLTLLIPLTVVGMDLDLRSETYLHLYQLDRPIGQDTDHALFYEYLSLDVLEAGHPGVSLHISGWARFSLADEAGGEVSDNNLNSGHVYYRYNDDRGQIRLGRFFLTEGTSLEALDGILLKQSLGRIGFSLFGGSPNSDSGSEDIRGDLLLGARTFFLSAGRFEVGLNYLTEDGDYGGKEREEAGADLWIHPIEHLEVTGRALYNMTTSRLASDHFSLVIKLTGNSEVILGSSGYRYEDLFQVTTNSAFSGTLINPDDEVRVFTGKVQWHPTNRLDLTGSVTSTDHQEDDPGDTYRSEIGLDISSKHPLEKIGLRTAIQTGDQPENEYSEFRGFAMLSTGSMDFSLDAMTIMYKQEIDGESQTIQVVGSAGWAPADTLSVSGDLRLTKSPVFEDDIAVVLRARYGFGP